MADRYETWNALARRWRRTWAWRLLSILCIVACLLLLRNTGARGAQDYEFALPTSSPLAQHFPSSAQLAQWYGTDADMTLRSSIYPESSVLHGETLFDREILRRSVNDAWSQSWGGPFPAGSRDRFIVKIDLVDLKTQLPREVLRPCIPSEHSGGQAWKIDGTVTAGVMTQIDRSAMICARYHINGYLISLWARPLSSLPFAGIEDTSVASSEPAAISTDDQEAAIRLITEVGSYFAKELPAHSLAPAPLYTDRYKAILAAKYLAIIIAAVALVLPGKLFENRLRERLWNVRVFWRRNPYLWDAKGEAKILRARTNALGMCRFLLFLLAVWAVEKTGIPVYPQLVAAFAVYVVVSWTLSAILKRRKRTVASQEAAGGDQQPSQSHMRSGNDSMPWSGRILTILGGLCSLAALAWCIAQLVTLRVASLELGTPLTAMTNLGPRWYVGPSLAYAQVLTVLAMFLTPIPLQVGRKLAGWTLARKNKSLGFESVHSVAREHPVLMLRNFRDDYRYLRVRRSERGSVWDVLLMRRKMRFEEVVAAEFAQYGQPVAVGDPAETLPPATGAYRFYLGDDVWQQAVEELADQAAYVVVMVARSHYLQWEMDHLQQAGHLHKTIFLFPPVGERERRKRLAVFGAHFGIPWPRLETRGSGRSIVAACFPGGHEREYAVMADYSDDCAYEVAIAQCVEALERSSVPTRREQIIENLRAHAESTYIKSPSQSSDNDEAAIDAVVSSQVRQYSEQIGNLELLQEYSERRWDARVGAPPLVEILAPGQQKRYKPWWQRGWIVAIVCAMISSQVGYWTARPESVPGWDRRTITMPTGVSGSLIGFQDHYLWYTLGQGSRQRVLRLDLNQDDNSSRTRSKQSRDGEESVALKYGKPQGSTLNSLAWATVTEDYVIATARSTGADEGEDAEARAHELFALHISDGSEAWRTPLPEGTISGVVSSGKIYLAFPHSATVGAYDLATGAQEGTVNIGCTPWSITADESNLWVACPSQNFSPRIDLRTFEVTERVPVSPGVLQVAMVQGEPVYLNGAQGTLGRSRSSGSAGTEDEFGTFTIGDPILAIQPSREGAGAQSDALMAITGLQEVFLVRGGQVEKTPAWFQPRDVTVSEDGIVAFLDERGLNILKRKE